MATKGMASKNILLIVFVLIALACVFLGIRSYRATMSSSTNSITLNTAMRKLWADHVIWTREYINAAVAQEGDLQDVTNRLLRNQVDIGNAIVPYYGQDAGQKLAELLKEHILVAAEVVDAARKSNNDKLKEADKKWHENAQDIAHFLSSANAYWTYQAMVDMLNEHLRLTTDEAVTRIKQDWVHNIESFDAIFTQALMMADDLTNGIVKQFPEKF